MTFVRHAQRRLAERTRELDERDQDSWAVLEDARHGFMNVVVAAGKRFGIEPFASIDVPRLENFGEKNHRQFQADLDHYMTQLLLDNSIRGNRESVPIPPKSKDRIRTHLHSLTECVNNADLSEEKRARLLRKIEEFDRELDKRRVSYLAVALVTVEILAIPGALWSSADITTKLVTNVLQEVGEAKAVLDETRELPSVAPPAALLPPRQEESPSSNSSADLDDEIPF